MFLGIGRRNVEGGGRRDDLEHTSYRGVLGVRGNFGEAWSYDAYGLYGTTVYKENFLNDFSASRLGKALTVVNDPTTGQPVCRVNVDADVTNDDAKCVPYNIWQLGGVTAGGPQLRAGAGLPAGSDRRGSAQRLDHRRSRPVRCETADRQ